MTDTRELPPSLREQIMQQGADFKARKRVTDVLTAVHAERQFQDAKWGTIDQHGHSLAEWVMIAEAELAEARLAVIKGGSGRNSLRSEIIQTMAVLQAALEQHGVADEHEGRAL